MPLTERTNNQLNKYNERIPTSPFDNMRFSNFNLNYEDDLDN